MTPTHVFGFAAREYAQAHGWTDAFIIEGNSLNSPLGAKGDTPETAREIVITPGEYREAHGFVAALGPRRYVTLRGAEEEKPKLINSKVTASKFRQVRVYGLECVNTPIWPTTAADDGPGEFTVEHNYLHSWTENRNGIACDEEQSEQPLTVNINWNEFDSCGSPSNLKHAVYVGTRAHSVLTAIGNVFRGARGCSQLKSKCNENYVRRNEFYTQSTKSDYTANSMIDIPACSRVVVSSNKFHVWRGDRQALPAGQNGLVTPPIHWRLRLSLDGSDIPAYPRQLLYPDYMQTGGKLDYVAAVSPGNNWSPDWQTWMDERFWEEVASWDVADPRNPYTYWFQKFVSGNLFTYLPGNLEEKAPIRDDGTWCFAERAQGTAIPVALPIPRDYRERSVTFMCDNTFEGVWLDPELTKQTSAKPENVCPGHRERSQPWHYPRAVEVQPVTTVAVPDWFPQ